jgi:type IV pilus assembly protein PilW
MKPILARGNGKMNCQDKGFSLIEIVVAMAIGVLSMVVMLQIYSNSEGQKRSTTGGADAQTNGATGLYLLERDMKMAGWGLQPNLYLGKQTLPLPQPPDAGCTNVRSFCNSSASCSASDPAGANFSFLSVRVVDGGIGADTITARFFSNPNLSVNASSGNVEVPNSTPYQGDTGTVIDVISSQSCHDGDLMLVSDSTVPTNNPGSCTIMQVTGNPVPAPAVGSPAKITHVAGVTSPFNNPFPWPVMAPTWNPSANARLTCFQHPLNGPVYERGFSIDGTNALVKSDNTLLNADLSAANPVLNDVVASGIINLQAQYGIAADQSQQVVQWVNPTAAAGWDNPTPKAAVFGATSLNRLQNIKAVRIALLARSVQYEKPNPATGLCEATTAKMVAAWPQWNGVATFATPTVPANWNCYKYKVFETIVPLRNIIWAQI